MGQSDPSKSSGLRSQSDGSPPLLTTTLIYLLLYRLFYHRHNSNVNNCKSFL